MSPNTPPAFEALPVEVLGNILKQMASPEDLYSTIRASARAFGSFLWFREEILIVVLQAGLPAEIFAEFLALLHAPKYEEFNYVPTQSELKDAEQEEYRNDGTRRDWEICKNWAWPDIVNGFFERHFENVCLGRSSEVQIYSTPQPADKWEVNYLMSIYGMLKRFIWDYQLFVQSNMKGIAPYISDLDPASSQRRAAVLDMQRDWPTLRENETLRLQRGFLRYELCCRVNTIPDRDAIIIENDIYYIEDMIRPLHQYLHRWEEEEIRCVSTYVHKQYQILVRDIVVDFRCDVRRLSRKTRKMPDSEVIIAPAITPGLYGEYLDGWTYSMSSYGLSLLQQLLRSEFDDQRRFLQNTCRQDASDPGFPILQDDQRLRHQYQRDMSLITPPNSTGANVIYIPMIDYLATRQSGDTEEAGLKEHGWIFWEDPTRLGHFAQLQRVTNGGFRVVDCRNPPVPHAGFEEEHRAIWRGYPEQIMYVTKEDHQALSTKYAVKGLTPEGERFFLGRLRAISDQPSKEVQPVFQELCSGMPSVESPQSPGPA